jgi:hypothetical protein
VPANGAARLLRKRRCVLPQSKSGKDNILIIDNFVIITAVFRFIEFGEREKSVSVARKH